MSFSRLGPFVKRLYLFLFLSFLFLCCAGELCLADETIAPDRKISVVFNNPQAPEWKVLWDEARVFVGQGDFAQAEKKYNEIYTIKPNIEEANWEYCKVLLELEDFGKVSNIIAGLLEISPRNVDYLLVGGRIALLNKDYIIAGKYLGRAFQIDPVGDTSDIALEGFIQSLRGQGKNDIAFSLQEQLILRMPDNSKVVHEAAIDAQELHKNEKARHLYEKLLKKEDVDDRVIYQATKVFDAPGFEKKTAALREEYLKRHPDYLPFHKMLAEYYLQIDDPTSAVSHLIYLSEHNDEYLIQTGKVYFYQLDRPDKALWCFEKYIDNHPGDINVNQTVEEIQTFLANEFMAIVENDGALPLWKDLIKVTANRLAIYMKMADLLESKGRTKELIGILTIIHDQYPSNDTIALRIARQYLVIDEREKALAYLDKIKSSTHKTISYYIFKGDIEILLGRELDALHSYESALELNLKNTALRAKCVKLAGSLGLVDTMRFLFVEGVQENFEKLNADIVLNYLDQLSQNFLFHEYEQVCESYQHLFASDNTDFSSFVLHKARTYRKFGSKRRAEQLLRESIIENDQNSKLVFELASYAIVDKNINTAKNWRTILSGIQVGKDTNGKDGQFECSLLLLDAQILRISGDYPKAIGLIKKKRAAIAAVLNDSKGQTLLEKLDTELCWLYYFNGEYTAAYRNLVQLLKSGVFNSEVASLLPVLSRKKAGSEIDSLYEDLFYETGSPVTSRLLKMVSTELTMQEYEDARKHLDVISETVPESMIGRIQFVELLAATRQFDEAVGHLEKMITHFPLEPYFYELLVEIETKRGNYQRGVALLEKKSAVENIDSLVMELVAKQDIKGLLTLARLVWGEKRFQEALDLYSKLLSPSVVEILGDEFQNRQINYLALVKKNNFWRSKDSLLQSEPGVVNELMAPAFLMDNRENDAGGIVAENFAQYSWQKLISYEYLARKAVFERRYASAEHNYKRLFEEDENSIGLMDLASIYGKFGKYRKEAQIYETIQSQGADSPELQDSIERNTLLIRPQSTIDTSYLKKDGRDGYLDITQASAGTSFTFTPELDKDINIIYSYSEYGDVDSDETVIGHYLFGSGVYEFAKDYELELGVGGEKVDSDNNATLLYRIGLRGQLDEYFSAFINYDRSMVSDTLKSVKEQIASEDLMVGLECETPIGLLFGGTLRHRDYNDSNSQNSLHAYSSFSYFMQDFQLSLLYDFQYINGDVDDVNGLTDEFWLSKNEKLYWNPDSFTEHLLTFRFKHNFFGYQSGNNTGISYYSIDNAVGFEEDEVLSYLGAFNIFLEMSPQFLLKGNLTFSTSSVYEEKGVSLSLHYRW